MNIFDFIPQYPSILPSNKLVDLDDSTFNQAIFTRKEFYDLKLDEKQPNLPQDGTRFKHQELVARFLSPDTLYDELYLFHSPGTGKCHAKNTMILMHDGTIRPVQDIQIGDLLMGDDSTPRIVQSLVKGRGNMYEIQLYYEQTNKLASKYVVNADHILVLKALHHPKISQQTIQWFENNTLYTRNLDELNEDELTQIHQIPQIVEISVKDYLNASFANDLYGYRVGVDFPLRPVSIDPYILGLWLGGKGNELDCYCFEIKQKLFQYSLEYQLQFLENAATFHHSDSEFAKRLASYNITSMKHIPYDYKCNSRQVRLQILAGIIDATGTLNKNYFTIIIDKPFRQGGNQFIQDIVYLCQSLGFECTLNDSNEMFKYSKESVLEYSSSLRVDGENLHQIPVLYSEHKTFSTQSTPRGFSVVINNLIESDYYGFSVDKNARYLLSDFIVTHNSCSAVSAIETVIEKRNSFNIGKALILVKNEGLIRQFEYQIMHTCTGGKYARDISIENASSDKPKVSSFYHLYTYATFYNEFRTNITRLVKEFSNCVIVIDEVHDLLHTRMYPFFLDFLHQVQNRKIILLSGTPMMNQASDIALLMNLILPMSMQLATGDEFNDLYIDSTTGFLKPRAENILASIFRGRISYLKSRVDIKTEYQGRPTQDISIPVVQHLMSPFQTRNYKHAFEMDKTVRGSFYIPSLEASLFVYPDGSFGTNGYTTHVSSYQDRRGRNLYSAPFLDRLRRLSIEQKLQEIDRLSVKYGNIIRNIINHPNQCVFVYLKSITGSGAIIFGLCLELFGYTRTVNDVDKRAPRYAILSGETGTRWDDIRNTFNSAKNRFGEYIQVLIGGEQVKQGITFNSIQQVHIGTPEWNFSNIDQALARAIRIGAHKHLSKNTPVKLFLHIANPERGESVDYLLYREAQIKDTSIKSVEYLIKTSAIDCALNYDRNVMDSKSERDCEYYDCLYRCRDIQLSPPYTVDQPNPATFQLLYEDQYISKLIEFIEDILSIQSKIPLEEIETLLGTKYTRFQLIRGLSTIIENRMIIRNRYGYPCFLSEENNIFFLVDSIHKDSFYASFYTEYPVIESGLTQQTLNEQINSKESLLDDVRLIISLSETDKIRMIPTVSMTLQEIFLEQAVYADRVLNITTPLITWILTYYNQFIQIEGDIVYSSLLPNRRKFSNKKWTTDAKTRAQPEEQKEETTVSMLLRGKGWLGRYKGKKNDFSIIDMRDLLNASEDKILLESTKRKGQNCSTRELSYLESVITELNIPIPESFSINDARKALQRLKIEIGADETDDEIRLKGWMTLGKKQICLLVEKWFKENKLILS